MILKLQDYNGADQLFAGKYKQEWAEVEQVLVGMPIHLKPSDQAGIKGTPIFDPVGTNQYIKQHLQTLGWVPNIPVPMELAFLGLKIDFGKQGVIAEVQFSNYPFFFNNILRSEMFYKAGIAFTEQSVEVALVITKAKMFPASNSTLYFEQGSEQLGGLAQYNVFDIPVRLVGLFEEENTITSVTWTEYGRRYSRTFATRVTCQCRITPGGARCHLELL